MDRKTSDKIISSLFNFYGEVKADLDFKNTYQLAVAVVLSAQTTDKQVNGVTGELFSRYPDFKTLGEAKQKDVEKIIKSTGFYRNKAENIIKMGRTVTEQFKGKLPRDRESLTTLPGVGRKSANVILSVGFGIPALAVDTHVMRIANRLGYIESENPFKIEEALSTLIPEEKWNDAHLLLIRHGRSICKARNPLCGECPIEKLCGSSDKTL